MRIGGSLAVVGALALSGCGTGHVTDSRASVLLLVENIEEGGPVLSDVRSANNSIVNCDVEVTATAVLKNQLSDVSEFERVSLSSYRVRYTRTDGRSTQGVDVPYEITGPMTISIAAGEESTFPITVVRHQAKIEPPLDSIAGLDIVTMSASVTLFGQTLGGDGVSAEGSVQITFADYADGTTTCESGA